MSELFPLISKAFLRAVAAMLVVTAFAKLWFVGGQSQLPLIDEPLFNIPYGKMLIIAAFVEIAVAAVCVFGSESSGLISCTWLAFSLATYRAALWWFDWQMPCSCLGNLTDALHISPHVADNVMKGLLAFMLIGSVSLLILHWRKAGSANARETGASTAATN